MAAPPKLRTVPADAPTPADETSAREPRPESGDDTPRSATPRSVSTSDGFRPSPWWIFLGLAAAGYAILAYVHADQRARIATLEAEVTTLQAEIELRERLIDAQSQRLSDVRTRVESLTELLDTPLEPAPE